MTFILEMRKPGLAGGDWFAICHNKDTEGADMAACLKTAVENEALCPSGREYRLRFVVADAPSLLDYLLLLADAGRPEGR